MLRILGDMPRLDPEDLSLRLCRTNWLLRALRDHLDGALERYVKWYMGGAFNGIGLEHEHGSVLADFHLRGEEQYRRDDLPVFDFGDVQMTLSCGESVDVRVPEAALTKADEAFDALETKPVDQVGRVHVYGIVAAGTGEERAAALLEPMERALGCRFDVLPLLPFALEPGQTELDAEALLEAPMPAEEASSRLASIIPAVRDAELFGFGVPCPNHEGGQYPHEELTFAHLTARHF